ncbi:hypothetical protein ACFX1S_041964 [Malus domestica]
MFFCLHRISKTTPTGVMTFSFIQAIEYGHGTTNGDILSSMRSTTTRRMKKEPQLQEIKSLSRRRNSPCDFRHRFSCFVCKNAQFHNTRKSRA